MENFDTTDTTKKESSKIIVYIIIIAVVIGLIWYSNRGNSEKFSNEDIRPELKVESKPENRRRIRRIRPNIPIRQRQENEQNKEDIDETIRRQAILSHQRHLAEMEKEEKRLEQVQKEQRTSSTLPVITNIQPTLPLAANVPPQMPTKEKPFEPEDNNLVKFAKDTQYIVDKYRPNDIYKQLPNDNGSFYELTADDRTIALMNQIDSNKNINDVACNLSNSLSDSDKEMVSDYKNKYYKMYAHQINCANGVGNLTGCGKRCYANGMSPMQCTNDSCRKSMNELNNSSDFVMLNQLLLEKNNSRPCSTCTQGPMLSRAVGVQNILDQVTDFDNVTASFMDSQVVTQQPPSMRENFQNLSNELKNKDKELTQKKKVTFANVNNFANFNNYVNQNGVLETSVDKLAEIRSDVTNSATCGLNQYGQTISDVYDNLMKNPYMEYKKACDINKITGISDNRVNDYQGNGNFGGNYSGNFASIQ